MRLTLLRHDGAVIAALSRDLIRRRGDLATIVLVVPLLALIARGWVAEMPTERRELIAWGAGFLLAAMLTQSLVERVGFHRTEGAVAHDAQRPAEWSSLVLPLLLAGIVGGLGAIMAIGIALAASWATATGVGIVAGLAMPFTRQRAAAWWRGRRSSAVVGWPDHRWSLWIGVATGTIVGGMCALLPDEDHLDAIVVGGYALGVIILTARVDADTVRYMAVVGRSVGSTLRQWLPVQLALLLPVSVVMVIAQRWVPMTVATLAATGLIAVTTVRILAYRAYGRRIADWISTILMAIVGFVTVALPPLAVLLLIAVMIWLLRRGKDSEWVID